MDVRGICDQWVELAYTDWFQWLRIQRKKTYLRDSTCNIIERMRTATKNSEREEEAWNTLERLKRLAEKFKSLDDNHGAEEYIHESSEIYLECALAAYQMNDLQEAMLLLRTPIGEFPNHSLHKAISYWMFGCVQWQFQAHLEDALASRENSLQIVKDVESDKRNDLAFVKKCLEIRERMTEAIQFASINIFPPPVTRKAKPSKAAPKRASGRLATFPVYGPIAAGPPSWIPPDPDEFAEVASVNLNDKQYYFHSLRNEQTINLHSGRTYFLLQVRGDSMNQAKPIPIEDGDYVLMVKQEAAENGDIVAVEIIREDEVATLKRYRFKDGRHILEPESDNPDLPPHISMDKDFYIRGIVLAVLKSAQD